MCGSCCGGRGMKAWGVISALLAVGCFSVAIWVPRAIDQMLDDGVNDGLVIDATAQADNTDAYQTYVDPNNAKSTPVFWSIYFWNVKNAAAVLGGALPDVEEKGPYVYQKKTYKHNVHFSTNVYAQKLVSYQTQTQYVFVPERSAGAESDRITNANLPFVAAPKNPLWQLFGPPGAADYARYWTNRNVTEWLFGFSLNGVPVFPGIFGTNENAPNPNAANDTLYIGAEPDQNLIRTYVKYQGIDSLVTRVGQTSTFVPSWKSGAANRVTGTDATVFQRHLQEGQTIQIFTSQLWRVVTLGNANNEKVKFKDIDLLHFTIPNVFLQNAANYPPNGDFYMLGYSGVANLTAAGKPDFFVTKPHYLDADAALIESVTGVSAGTKEVHDTFLNVEPFTGLTMQGAKRLQLAARLTPAAANDTATWGAGLPNQGTGQYVPVYWGEEYAEISDSDADSFVTKVYGAQTASYAIRIAGQAAACLFTVIAVVLLLVAAGKSGSSAAVAPGGGGGVTDTGAPRGGNGGDDNRVVPIQIAPAPAPSDKLAPSSMQPSDAPAGAN